MTDIKDLTLRFYKEVFDNADLDAIDELIKPDAVDHEIPKELNLPAGREGIRLYIKGFLDAFSPMTVEVHDLLQDGDKVVARAVYRGTHTGELQGIAPTGRSIEVQAIDIMRFEGDKMAEHWGIPDNLSMLQQLGVIPKM